MFLFAGLAFVSLWFKQSERNDVYNSTYNGSFFSHQVSTAWCAAYTYHGSFNSYLVQIQ